MEERHCTCKECGRNYIFKRSGMTLTTCNSCVVNRRRRKLRKDIISYMGDHCYKCGYSKCYGALHVHHINPENKSFNISGSHSRSWEAIIEELDKCILLCANCHFEEHHPCSDYGCPGDVVQR